MIGDVKHTYFYMAYNVNWDLKQSHKIVKFANDIVISNLFFTYGLTNLKKNKKKKPKPKKMQLVITITKQMALSFNKLT